jgi:hypothetical protein
MVVLFITTVASMYLKHSNNQVTPLKIEKNQAYEIYIYSGFGILPDNVLLGKLVVIPVVISAEKKE